MWRPALRRAFFLLLFVAVLGYGSYYGQWHGASAVGFGVELSSSQGNIDQVIVEREAEIAALQDDDAEEAEAAAIVSADAAEEMKQIGADDIADDADTVAKALAERALQEAARYDQAPADGADNNNNNNNNPAEILTSNDMPGPADAATKPEAAAEPADTAAAAAPEPVEDNTQKEATEIEAEVAAVDVVAQDVVQRFENERTAPKAGADGGDAAANADEATGDDDADNVQQPPQQLETPLRSAAEDDDSPMLPNQDGDDQQVEEQLNREAQQMAAPAGRGGRRQQLQLQEPEREQETQVAPPRLNRETVLAASTVESTPATTATAASVRQATTTEGSHPQAAWMSSWRQAVAISAPASEQLLLPPVQKTIADQIERHRLIVPSPSIDTLPFEPTPPYLLRTFYWPEVRKYPHLLTWEPQVDCDRGRYLFIRRPFADGFGVTRRSLIKKLEWATLFGMSAVYNKFESTHHENENDEDRDRFWQDDKWEVRLERLMACPDDSNVRRHWIASSVYNHNMSHCITETTCDETMLNHTRLNDLRNLTAEFAASNTGMVLELDTSFFISDVGWNGPHQMIAEIRWNVENRPFGNDYLHAGLIDQARADKGPRFRLSVHVRRGDVVNAKGEPLPEYLFRHREPSYYLENTRWMTTALGHTIRDLQQHFDVTVFSEGKREWFDTLVRGLNQLQFEHVDVDLDSRASAAFAHLVESDVVVHFYSSFTSASDGFHARHIKFGYHGWMGMDTSVGFFGEFNTQLQRDRAIKTRLQQAWLLLWYWKHLRLEAFARCSSWSRQCLEQNPHVFLPLGPAFANDGRV